jgi:hypothetical protein
MPDETGQHPFEAFQNFPNIKGLLGLWSLIEGSSRQVSRARHPEKCDRLEWPLGYRHRTLYALKRRLFAPRGHSKRSRMGRQMARQRLLLDG